MYRKARGNGSAAKVAAASKKLLALAKILLAPELKSLILLEHQIWPPSWTTQTLWLYYPHSPEELISSLLVWLFVERPTETQRVRNSEALRSAYKAPRRRRTHTHTHAQTHTHTHTHTHAHTHTHTLTHTLTQIHTYTRRHTYEHTRPHKSTYS